MVDGEARRPRRAWVSDEPEVDDTPADAAFRPRRGDLDETAQDGAAPEGEPTPTSASTPSRGLDESSPVTPRSAATPAAVAPSDEDTAQRAAFSEDPANPFARPGSQAAQAPAPVPTPSPSAVEAPAEPPITPIPAPVLPRSATGSTFQGPAPRRSALSTTSPADLDESDRPHWFEVHRATLLRWAGAGLAIALVLTLLTYFIVRGVTGEPGDSPSPSPSGTASPSATSTVAPVTTADLLTGEDLSGLSAAANWSEVSTTESIDEHQGFALCLPRDVGGQVNPTYSLQRSLGTTTDDGLAALHQIDVYANPEAATTVMDARVAALSACADVPVLIERSSTITGLAERAFQLTVLEEGLKDGKAQNAHHTILLTQEGSALQLVDGKRLEAQIEPAVLATALVRPQTALNAAQGKPGDLAPVAVDAVVPAAEPFGWPIPADLPRVRPGAGRWQARGPQPVSIPGTGCENMTLASESGPTERQEMRYTLTQDDQAPALFGVDQVLFTFDNATTAGQFTSRLGNNLTTCKNRVLTATVERSIAVTTDTAVEAKGSSIGFAVTQSQGNDAASTFQVLVSVVDKHVAYTVITVEGDYKFSDAQLSALANRIAVRASQS